ncbi:hypothetical protein [Nostoc sp. FACHB-892]
MLFRQTQALKTAYIVDIRGTELMEFETMRWQNQTLKDGTTKL